MISKIFGNLKEKLGFYSKKKLFWVILIVLFTIPTFSSLVRSGFFPMQDDLQAFRVYEMDKCFQDFQIPCRWVPDAGYQYGYPQFNYYPPSVYYLGEIFHKVGFQFIDTVKILFALGYTLSALVMFLLVSDFLDNFSGFVSALVYTYVPYKAVEVFVRGDLSEFWSLVFFPLVFWAVYKLIKTSKAKYIALLGLSLGLLLTTHLLMAMIFSIPAIVWTIYWLIREKKLKEIYKVIAGVLLGIGFAAFYVLPVIFERQYAHTETLLEGYFGYQQHFVNLYRLFISREWGYGSSGFPNEKLNLSTGIIQWIFGIITLGISSFYIFIKKKKKDYVFLALILGMVELFTLFMIHVKSSFIWSAIPMLAWLQFPWRFLAVSIFLLSILAGIGIFLIPKFKVWIGLIIVLISFILTVGYFVPKSWENITDADKFSGVSWQKELTISIFDYLPIYAKFPPISPAPNRPEILQGSANFSSYSKGSDFQKGIINVKKEALIRLPLFDFPGMVTKIDGQKVSHVNNNCMGESFCLGLITFEVPSGTHTIDVRLTDTPVRKIGNWLSVISLVTVAALLVIKKKNEKIH
ncbi:MAG: glycosyltransferase family 39 protein [Candidatus Microgenomates bacterium]